MTRSRTSAPRLRSPVRALLGMLTALSLGGAANAGPPADTRVAPATRGLFVALRVCAACHAVGPLGAGPDREAPSFVTIRLRHDPASLRRRLAEISTSGHQQMPPIPLTAREIEDVASYIETVLPAPAPLPSATQAAAASSQTRLSFTSVGSWPGAVRRPRPALS